MLKLRSLDEDLCLSGLNGQWSQTHMSHLFLSMWPLTYTSTKDHVTFFVNFQFPFSKGVVFALLGTQLSYTDLSSQTE